MRAYSSLGWRIPRRSAAKSSYGVAVFDTPSACGGVIHWQTQAEQHFQDHSAAICFQNNVARLWRLEHALRTSSPCGNGQKKFNKAALEAQQWLVA